MSQSPATNPVSRWFRKLTGGDAAVRTAPRDAATPIASCGDRQIVDVRGTVGQLTPVVSEGRMRLEAQLSDESGSVRLVWMGRSAIPGVENGRALRVVGRLACIDGTPTMFNPRYELRTA